MTASIQRLLLSFFALIVMGTGFWLHAQPSGSNTSTATTLPASPSAPETIVASPPRISETLRTLHNNYQNVLRQLAELRKQASAEKDESIKNEINLQIANLEKRRSQIEADFMLVVSGVSEQEFASTPSSSTETSTISIQQELNSLIAPLISELREITKRPRALENLQGQIASQEAKLQQAEAALQQTEQAIAELKAVNTKADKPLQEGLQQVLKTWQTRRDETADNLKVLRYQLEDLRQAGTSFWGQIAHQAKRAVFTRGLNIILALLAFVLVLAILRAIYFYVMKYLPLRQYQRLSFTARLLDVLHHGVSLALAFLAALLVLYTRGDWLLGSLAVLALIGVILAAKSGFGNYLEQVRMLLNLGSAREGERVFINGVPWKVGRIGLFTQLTNPIVGGPGLRIPLEQLMQMNSRVSVKDETWFPCKKGDQVLLNGKEVAKVLNIGPDYVEIEVRGGQRRWIATGDFMNMDVTSLHNGFSVSTIFGVDYRYQAEATTTIPQLLAKDIRESYLKLMPKEHLLSIVVEFQNASPSSLDYLISARFSGDQAENYATLLRALQRFALESCNEHGWSIPFPQLVINQPETENPINRKSKSTSDKQSKDASQP